MTQNKTYYNPEEVVGNFPIYHRPDCRTLRSYGLRLQSWKEAVVEGMRPCRVCGPEFLPIPIEIVIGNGFTYHQPDCHIIKKEERYRLTKFQSWEDAVAEGMKPCEVCKPSFFTLKEEEVISGMFTYHRPHCRFLEYIQPMNIERYQSWEKAEAKFKIPCNFCRPSLIITTEPTLQIEALTNDPTPAIGALTNETKTQIEVPSTKSTPQSTVPDPRVSESQISTWRRKVAQLVGKLDQEREHSLGEGLAGKIGRLTRENVIPRHVAACMRTVTEMRNAVEYESKTLSQSESKAVRATWEVIEEWAQDQKFDL